jgi:hypothetical protein
MELSVSKLQAAISWVNERLRGYRGLAMRPLLEDAARRFDLDLREQQQLHQRFRM